MTDVAPCGCLAVKFDSCNSLLSSIHTLLLKILRCVRLYIIGLNENINTVCRGIFGYNIEIKPSICLGVYNAPSSGCRKLDEVEFYRVKLLSNILSYIAVALDH